MKPNAVSIACLGLSALLLQTAPASAYLDPGTGSMMLQAIIGGIVAAGVVGRLYWYRLKASVSSLFSGRSRNAGAARSVKASSEADAPDG